MTHMRSYTRNSQYDDSQFKRLLQDKRMKWQIFKRGYLKPENGLKCKMSMISVISVISVICGDQ